MTVSYGTVGAMLMIAVQKATRTLRKNTTQWNCPFRNDCMYLFSLLFEVHLKYTERGGLGVGMGGWGGWGDARMGNRLTCRDVDDLSLRIRGRGRLFGRDQ